MTRQEIEELLRDVSRSFAGGLAPVSGGEVLSNIRQRLRAAEREMPARLTFTLGPVTISVEGLPECVRAQAATVMLTISPHFDDDPIDAFVERFRALGGTETFESVDPSDPYSARSEAHGVTDAGEKTLYTSVLALHAPQGRRIRVPAVEALTRALEDDRSAGLSWATRSDGEVEGLRPAQIVPDPPPLSESELQEGS